MRLLAASLLLTVPAIPAPSDTGFEVASIRPSQPRVSVQDARVYFRGDRFEAKAMTVGDLLDMLAGTESLNRVTGGPPWVRTDRYDIAAKAGHDVAPPDQYAAVMPLLRERFKLQFHKETREVPGLVLRSRRMPSGLNRAMAKFCQRSLQEGHFSFTAAPLGDITNFLSQAAHVPVTNETELQGAYDFAIDVQPQPGEGWGDRRLSVEMTVVDHCERPTEN